MSVKGNISRASREMKHYNPSSLAFPAGAFTKSGGIENYGEQSNLFS